MYKKYRWYWKDEENLEFIEDWKAGVLSKDMAIKFDVAASTISQHARRLGLRPRRVNMMDKKR